MNKENAIDDVESRLRNAKVKFCIHADWLGKNLVESAKELQSKDTLPNSLGVCQTQAHDIDMLCKEMKLLTEQLDAV